jgi:hypothetical protein
MSSYYKNNLTSLSSSRNIDISYLTFLPRILKLFFKEPHSNADQNVEVTLKLDNQHRYKGPVNRMLTQNPTTARC